MSASQSFRFTSEQFVAYPLEKVFLFFSKPENLEAITPTFLKFKILTPSPIEMKKGAEIDYQIRLMGIPLKWKTLITEYEPNAYFIDEQTKGPYRSWIHRHEFREVSGGTQIRDEVIYSLPFGVIGQIAHFLWIRRTIGRIFDHRRAAILDYFPESQVN